MAQKISGRASSEKRKTMRQSLWPEITDDELWLRTKSYGFTTIPRVMSLIMRIIDKLSEKGFPLSGAYLTLWCWVFDEAFVEIRNPREFAYESGFSGPRAEATWKVRMKRLESLGFIKAKAGIAGEFQYVVILNPIKVIEKIYEANKKDEAYHALIGRLIQVGATDINLGGQ